MQNFINSHSIIKTLTVGALLFSSAISRAQDAPQVLAGMDLPFLYAYTSWENKVRVENGHAILRGEGVTGQGGAGFNQDFDLSQKTDFSPALIVKVGAKNVAPNLRLRLVDDKDHGAIWEFAVPKTSDEFVTITPKNGASLQKPNELDKSGASLDLAKIRQVQLQGDWNAGALDVEIDAIALVAPNAEIMVQRAAQQKAEAEARAAQVRQNQELKARYQAGVPSAPKLLPVSMAAPDILSINIAAGHVVHSTLTPYQKQEGDETEIKKDDKGVSQVILKRGGQEIGWLLGPQRDQLVSYERLEGDPLVGFVADEIDTFRISSNDDANYKTAQTPTKVSRKTTVTDWAQPGRGFSKLHRVYLQLPHALQAGKNYTISLGELNVDKSQVNFHNVASQVLAEAVHVNQVGFRPDDPLKRAFLSLWLGTGGAYKFPDNLNFSLIEEKSNKIVYTGKVELAKAADENELMWKDLNYNKTDVYRMDFGDFKTPGRYRVYVQNVGCSYPFDIAPDVWQRAFVTQMRGLYNNRSGVELGPPFTDFRKPRDFHPADGVKVFQSTYSIEDGPAESKELAKLSTGKLVPEAWGGYHDAGDWNPRRVTHMQVTLAQLEMLDLFPNYFSALKLNIPAIPNVPDIMTEALFEIDCFRRLQKPDGGVPYGIETDGDPREGEVSWLQTFDAYVYAPDIYSSYYYASVATRAARLLQNYDKTLAATYRDSALRAMNWAEADYAKRKAAGTLDKLRWEATDARNLAALELLLLTRDGKWHDVFKENSFLNQADGKVFNWGKNVQTDAAFLYARADATLTDAAWRERAKNSLVEQADKALIYAGGNAWNLTTPDKGKPMFIGFYSTPDASELVRAHFLTNSSKYLQGVLQACLFQNGGNPNNITYTTGVGTNPIKNPLHLDSRRSGQSAPEGLTVYGNADFVNWNAEWITWPMKYYLNRECTPPAQEWPIAEAYWDIFLMPALTEFTVDKWGANVYAWGYLAARK